MGLVSTQTGGTPSGNQTGFSLSNIASDIQQFVVAPLAAFGLGGYVFDAQGEAVANLSADITDDYTEDNKFLQDHIALKPKRITLKGYVGELVYRAPSDSQSSLLNQVPQKLIAATAFLPSITAAASQIQSAASNPSNLTLPSALNTASNIYALVQNILGAFGTTKNQQNAYNYFKALWQSGTLMGVQTPWEFMTNMAIENITPLQAEESIFITDFAVSFKEIRIAQTQTTAYIKNAAASAPLPSQLPWLNTPSSPVQAGVAAVQAAPIIQQGPTPGAALPASFLSGFQGSMTNPGGISPSLFTYKP